MITLEPIGVIKTPFHTQDNMPIQSGMAKGVKGKIILKKKFADGLMDIDSFSYIIIIYHFHKTPGYKLKVIPFMDDKPHGVFATRAPVRPNPLGFSVVKLIKVENNILYVEDVDMLDGTPLIDIKPYIPQLDNRKAKRIGWLENKQYKKIVKSDKRFI